jgi:hypothetical protein
MRVFGFENAYQKLWEGYKSARYLFEGPGVPSVIMAMTCFSVPVSKDVVQGTNPAGPWCLVLKECEGATCWFCNSISLLP